jgi:hypothetical protein
MKLDSFTKPNICPSSVSDPHSTAHNPPSNRSEQRSPVNFCPQKREPLKKGKHFYTEGIYIAERGSYLVVGVIW